MPNLRLNVALLFVVLLLALNANAAPQLGVLIVVDQLRSNDVDKLDDFFGESGFGGLRSRGAQYVAEYSFAGTETGPGHATIATGTTPERHGIGSNRWWQKDGTRIYSAFDPMGTIVGATSDDKLGPAQLRTATLGDAMRAESNGRSKVIALSHKDRAAILTAGHNANLALWFNKKSSSFVTSRAYGETLPKWVAQFNQGMRARIDKGLWSPLDNKANTSDPDDQVGEDARFGGRGFPHHLRDLPAEKRAAFYRGTPTALEDLFTLARIAIENEKLGQRGEKDLLILSVSATDYVGHWFGPDSREMTDMLRRLDRRLRSFTRHLDRRLGRNGYALALTGDHGAPPLPERNIKGRRFGKKINAKETFAAVEAVMQKAAPKNERRIYGIQPPHLWVDTRDVKDVSTFLDDAAKALRAQPGIANAFRAGSHSHDPYLPVIKKSIAQGRSGQIFFRVEPYAFLDFTEDKTGVDHGSPYTYDRRVPLFIWGSEVKRGRYTKRVRPIDAVASLAFALRVAPPPSCEGQALGALSD